jgi:asparagine synthase (glutamine-hydrolysing)
MLDGQGADETLAGYHGYFGPFFADLLRSGQLRELGAELRAYRGMHGAGLAATAEALARPFLPERVRWAARGRARGGTALVHPDLPRTQLPPHANGFDGGYLRRQMQLILMRRGLPELLHYEDRNSMAHSLEARVPFLDYRLVELLFSLGASDLIRRGRTKDVLRRALGDLLPPVVRDRVDKLGFVTPEAAWLRNGLGELAADVFASREFNDRGFVDAEAARRSLARHRSGEKTAGYELWRALCVELWAREFL